MECSNLHQSRSKGAPSEQASFGTWKTKTKKKLGVYTRVRSEKEEEGKEPARKKTKVQDDTASQIIDFRETIAILKKDNNGMARDSETVKKDNAILDEVRPRRFIYSGVLFTVL